MQEQLLLTPAAFFVACQLNGRNGITDIQYAFARQFGGQDRGDAVRLHGTAAGPAVVQPQRQPVRGQGNSIAAIP